MGHGFKHGAGGGTSLNFAVAAYASAEALPDTAKENTIGVITDVAIAGYVFSATEPVEPVAGMVWFELGTKSEVAFSVTEKIIAMVYPVSCKQYVNGAWANTEAWSFVNTSWVQFSLTILYLYDNGDECADVSGGWALSTGDASSTSHGESVSKTSTYLQFTSEYVKNTNYAYGFLRAKTAIDLTDVNEVTLVCPYASINSDVPVRFGVAKSDSIKAYNNFTVSKALSAVSSVKEFTIDVSSLTGSYYIGIAAAAGSTDGSKSTVRISEVYCS